LQIKDWLAVRFILGMQKRERLGFVLGAQAVLLPRQVFLAVINPRSLEQDELVFIAYFSESRNQSGFTCV
jgi:hypothetical protein